MVALSSLYLPGAVALWCALFFLGASLWGYLRVVRGDESSRDFARRAYIFFAASVFLASVVLLVLLLRRDFRIEYVYQYSGLDLPWFFQLSAFWAGQKGSFLIWLLWGALLGVPLIWASRRMEAPVMGIYGLTQLGLLLILVRESPFVVLAQTPADGAGLNPLLQDNWMVIHPPIMFIGYAATAIPFAFAAAALWEGKFDRWASLAFPWALGGFMVLGTAILMGGYWAYKTLGWGGYWGWDPVENASLIPWLLGTVLIHGLYLERQKGRYKRANLVIACLGYLSVLYGTFLTRSGVLADFSVHSFVDLGISGWLVGLMGFFFAVSVYLSLTRMRLVEHRANEDPLLSRGSFLVLSTTTIAISAAVITVGTSAPILTRFLPNPGQVGPEFYNRVNLPIALLIAFFLALVPYLTWKGTPPRVLLAKMWVGIGGAAVGTVVAAALGVLQPFHLLFVFLASLALLTNLQKTIEKFRAQGLGASGGYLAHVGVGVIFLGILSSSAYDESAKVTLEQGVPVELDEMTLTFNRYLPRVGNEKERMEVEVELASGERILTYPRLFMNQRTRQVMANPFIEKFALEDLYISPIAYDPGPSPGAGRRVRLAKGETTSVADGTDVAFIGFDMNVAGNAFSQMQTGGNVTIGATLEVRREGRSEQVQSLFHFSPGGRVDSPPTPLPGGGQVSVVSIDATTGGIQLDFAGFGETAATPSLPKLSIDVTRKPLINLVWYGLYIVLAGGALAMVHRTREARVRETLDLPGT